MSIEKIKVHAETYFTEVVEKGSDQQLFIAGYLHGHFSLVLATIMQQDIQSPEQFKAILLASLDKAFAQKELDEQDQVETKTLVEQLFSANAELL